MEILAFCNGLLFFYTHSYLTVIIMLMAFFLKTPWQRSCIAFFLACAWAFLHDCFIHDQGMPLAAVIANATVIGRISSIPRIDESKMQFQLAVQSLNQQPAHTTALLSCYNHCPHFKLGEVWRFDAKLKKPMNLGNPGAFDYVTQLKSKHIFWTGYIQARSAHRIQAAYLLFPLLQWRSDWADNIQRAMQNSPGTGIIQALSLGMTKQMTSAQWNLFRQTGTTHLMVISGAHIGLIAGLFFFLAGRLWRYSARLCLWYPAQQAASVIAMCAAGIYAFVSGMAIPAERALIASMLVLGNNFISRRLTTWQSWRYALGLVMMLEPHAVLLPGFYLSFTAVAILLAGSQRLMLRGVLRVLCLQCFCLIGLMPMTFYWFSYTAINGFFANLVAIPFVGYLLVPLSLFGLLIAQMTHSAGWLFVLLDYLTKGLIGFLHVVDTTAWLNRSFVLTDPLSLIALIFALGLSVVLPIRAIWPAVGLIIWSVFTPQYSKPMYGEATVDVLDVGQGLAVLIQTRQHTLLYDTGVQFYRGGDMGQLAVLPYLRYRGIDHLDKIVISHPDLDHRGGLASIEQSIKVDSLIVNDIDYYHRGQSCHAYPDWVWDGVRFHFIALLDDALGRKNNTSCVLKVSTEGGSILLPGDIEKQAEIYLVNNKSKELRSTVLLVPHHGSKTSSSLPFLQQVLPRYAIISSEFDNRYHFPHQETINTYANQGVTVFNTMQCGLVQLILPQDGEVLKPACYNTKNK